MPLAPGFPTNFTEYLTVWCADLLEGLDDEQRRVLENSLIMMYEGGPWPDRFRIQRLAEQLRGVVDAETAIGELDLRRSGGVSGVIARLNSPDVEHQWVIEQLSRLQGTPQLVDAVTEACRVGLISPIERELILETTLSRPILPEPIPAPAEYPPLPPDHPESYEEYRVRDPGYQPVPPLDADIEAAIASLGDRFEAGKIDFVEFRMAQRELMNLGSMRVQERERLREQLEVAELDHAEYRQQLQRIFESFGIPERWRDTGSEDSAPA